MRKPKMDLFFAPMACSLAARIALYEAGLEAAFHRVQLGAKTLEDGSDFRAIAPKGQVPALRTADGKMVTEVPAVLQYIADQAPEGVLAPRVGSDDRFELQSWLNFVATEVHKQIFWTTFSPDTPPEAKAFARTLIPARLALANARLAGRTYLVGETFTVADAYLVWALLLMQRLGADFAAVPHVAAYLDRCLQRPAVGRAVGDEARLMAA
jgi:glutathione S-transferase